VAKKHWEGRPFAPKFKTLEQLNATSETFDICLVCGTLQYLDNPVTSISDILKKVNGGVYIRRTPFCVSSDKSICIRQLVYPPYGFAAKTYIWELQLCLISLVDFLNGVREAGHECKFMNHHENYRLPMLQLPDPFNNVHYIDLYIE
jgi:hypothetical protein